MQGTPAAAKENVEGIPQMTLVMYFVFLFLAIGITINDIYLGRIDQLILSIPTSVMLAVALVTDRKVAHVPPVIVIMMMVALILVFVANELKTAFVFLEILSSILTGVCLMLLGQILVYTMLHSSPEKEQDNKLFIYTAGFCIAMTVLLIMFLAQSFYYHGRDYAGFEIWTMTIYVSFAMIGAMVTAALSELGLDRLVINSGLNRRMEVYSGGHFSNDYARDEVEKIIMSGESEKLEFKSTITTNIQTGENDKRMEKAVLKTLVAFLNTSGGTLLIGVSDDGSIYGVDEAEFDSRDKMNLHLTHMISSKIGDEFLPYITFRVVDFDDGKAVVRIDCSKSKKPVFLKDGKTEEFYVRSGPSSVMLSGSNLVNYVTNKSVKTRQSALRSAIEDMKEN